MIRRLPRAAVLFSALALAGALPARAPPAAPQAPNSAASLDEVLVTGERPGPGMWRVSKGDHDLWILATLEPLPKNMTWRSQAVEMRIAASEAVLAPPRVSADVGFFRGLTLLPSLLHARFNPDGRTLQQVLPHDLYMRWLALRVKYLGRWSDDERLRPMLAALDVYTHAIDAAGLTSDDGVWTVVEKTAKAHRVPLMPVTLEVKIDDPKGAIRELERIPAAAEIACLQTTIERLETDIQPMRRRANLWSLGDIRGLRALRYPDERIACLDALSTVPKLNDQFRETKEKLTGAWLGAADRALEVHQTSFAVLPIGELLQPEGFLDRLRERGYRVQDPN